MIVALDANIVIYLVEKNPILAPIAMARLAALQATNDEIAFCDAGRLECLIKPLAIGSAADCASFQEFFNSPLIKMLPVVATTWEKAARLSAEFKFKPLDSIHLAAAIEHSCELFLTNDSQLSRCTAIRVDLLT